LTIGKNCDIIEPVPKEREPTNAKVITMASIRKRTWKSGGEIKTAWIADYFDQGLFSVAKAKELDFWAFRGTPLLSVAIASGTTARQQDADLPATRSLGPSYGGSTKK